MAVYHNLSILGIVQNGYGNFVKTAEVGTAFALSLSLSLSHRQTFSISQGLLLFFSNCGRGTPYWGIPAFFVEFGFSTQNISFAEFCERLQQHFEEDLL